MMLAMRRRKAKAVVLLVGVMAMLMGGGGRFVDASSVGAAPRRATFKSNTGDGSSSQASATLKTRQETLMRVLDAGAGDSPEETMRLFNGWGPFRSGFVYVTNMRGLPGRNVIHYPADRTSDDEPQESANLPIARSTLRSFPLAVYSYGYNASCTSKPTIGGSLHMQFMAYLASWGIVVGCPTSSVSDNWDGGVLTLLMDAMTSLNEDSSSMFYGRLKTDKFATIGRSYGGNRAVNAAAKNRSRVAAVVSDAQCTSTFCTPLRERDVAAPTLYLVGDRDTYAGGMSWGFENLSVPKQLLIASYRTHDSAPMQVWRSWTTLFILLHVNGDEQFAPTVWGPAFYSAPVYDPEWGWINIGSYKTTKYTNYWPMCASASDDTGALRYNQCPPVLCPTAQVEAMSGPSDIPDGFTDDDEYFPIPDDYFVPSALPRIAPRHIDIDESSVSHDLERGSMRQGLASFFAREESMKKLIAEVGESFDISDAHAFDVTACHVLQTLTTLQDKCAFDVLGNVSFEPDFEPLLFEIVKLVDTDGDSTVTQKETVAALRRYREGVSASYKNARIDGAATTSAAVCPTYTEVPGMDLFS